MSGYPMKAQPTQQSTISRNEGSKVRREEADDISIYSFSDEHSGGWLCCFGRSSSSKKQKKSQNTNTHSNQNQPVYQKSLPTPQTSPALSDQGYNNTVFQPYNTPTTLQ
ncbi:hypothetical protein L486_07555 [Kwoniella mangroviensis CBS 10435]|uniref:Uncharacterized protein n=1 Tax=Kwoniella mangroviensis CBS 10435 TaxID=1331196 RepID=A0A1B9IGT7_9TREE|nr:hypothetical protein L486_07555 [Kwoniella mangroviensis CBS 10435]